MKSRERIKFYMDATRKLRLVSLLYGVVLLSLLPVLYGGQLDIWNVRLETTPPLEQVAWGNGTFVALMPTRDVFISTNGTAWSSVPLPTGSPPFGFYRLHGITFANGIFVAVGSWGMVLTSTNGLDWTIRRTSGRSLNSVTFANGLFVAVGHRFSIVTSPDTVTWTERDGQASETVALWGISFGNGRFVGIGDKTSVVSTNGTNWSYQSFAGYGEGIAFGNGVFAAVGYQGRIFTSPEGVDWTERSSNTNDLLEITFTDRFVAVGANGGTVVSTNGAVWYPHRAPTKSDLSGVAMGGSQWVALGEQAIITSTNAIDWVVAAEGTGGLRAIASDTTQFVAVGYNGRIFVSRDGYEWSLANDTGDWAHTDVGGQIFRAGSSTEVQRGFKEFLTSICYGNGRFVAVGPRGRSFASTDGLTWKAQGWTNTPAFVSVAELSGRYFALAGSSVYVSTDGIDWASSSTLTNGLTTAIASGGGRLFVLGNRGLMAFSSNGSNWTYVSGVTSNSLYAAAYGNGRYVAVGDRGTVLTSNNGTNWILEAGMGTNILRSLIYTTNFVGVGDGGLVADSTDGLVWQTRNAGFPGSLFGLAANQNTYVAVSGSGVIFQSAGLLSLANMLYFDVIGTAFELRGDTGVVYTIDYSTNLQSWSPLTTVSLTNASRWIGDPSARGKPQRFYRAWR